MDCDLLWRSQDDINYSALAVDVNLRISEQKAYSVGKPQAETSENSEETLEE